MNLNQLAVMNSQMELEAAFVKVHESIKDLGRVIARMEQANCNACEGTGVLFLDAPGETGSGERCLEIACGCQR